VKLSEPLALVVISSGAICSYWPLPVQSARMVGVSPGVKSWTLESVNVTGEPSSAGPLFVTVAVGATSCTVTSVVDRLTPP
jgi:hypothetical protein